MVCLVKASIVSTPSEGKNGWCLVKANSFVLRTPNGARRYVRLNYIMQVQMLRAIHLTLTHCQIMIYAVVMAVGLLLILLCL